MNEAPTTPSQAALSRAEAIRDLPMAVVGGGPASRRSTWTAIREMASHRELLDLLIRREIKARYKDSKLGVLWSLLQPMTQFLVYFFAVGQIMGLARAIPSFAIFVFIGISTWSLFTEIVSSGTQSVTSNSGLVKKVYVPREIYPLATVGGALFNYAIQLLVLVVAVVAADKAPDPSSLWYGPLALAVTLVWAVSLALALSAVNVYLRDVQHLVGVALVVLFWASPIVYSFNFVHQLTQGSWLESLYLSNPITLAILGMQRALWVDGPTQVGAVNFPDGLGLRLGIALLLGFAALYLAGRVFNRLQANFAQEL